MKRLAFVLVGLLALTGCKYDINGVLNVNDKLKLDGVTYNPGSYNSSVSIKRTTFSGRYKIELEINDHNGKNTHKFKAAKGVSIPENGEINVTPSQLGAKYGLSGDITTNYNDSGRRRSYESCTYQEPYTVCQTDHRGVTVCSTHYRTVYGHRDVEYFMRTKDQNLFISLMEGEKAVGDFQGHYNGTYKVYTYEGFCR